MEKPRIWGKRKKERGLTEKIKALVEKYYPLGVQIRRAIHQRPERGFEEVETAALAADALESRGVAVQRGVAKTGVVGLITGGKPGKTVLLRADMDALEVEEKVDVPYKSLRPGLMHACGHDGHTAGLIMAGLVLQELKDELAGNVKLMFQPGEETSGGAEPMIREGVLENPRVDAAFGCHLWGSAPAGSVLVKEGPVMASPDEFKLRITGKGGHAGLPHLVVDPIIIAAHLINGFQSLVSRWNNPLKPLVLSVCSIHGGRAYNVIPDQVDMLGTIRTADHETRRLAHQWVEKITANIVRGWGADYHLELLKLFPPLVNDPAAAEAVRKAAAKIVGPEQVGIPELSMGGEDFAYITEKTPGAFFFVGIKKDKPVPHHNGYFAWDEEALKISAGTLCQTAVDYLSARTD
jgi:amidohydrolase